GSWYIFPVSFLTVNKNGEGNYYSGLALNNQVADGLDKNWGDITESSLASALSYISTGAFRTATASAIAKGTTTPAQDARVMATNKILDLPSFKGAIDPRGLK
ncbi:MAG TPA: hypothetical protein VFL47_16215, partial [Flavisolibacter sp.]|nr:hypothetical protein [Flavisolibacter sp.]